METSNNRRYFEEAIEFRLQPWRMPSSRSENVVKASAKKNKRIIWEVEGKAKECSVLKAKRKKDVQL